MQCGAQADARADRTGFARIHFLGALTVAGNIDATAALRPTGFTGQFRDVTGEIEFAAAAVAGACVFEEAAGCWKVRVSLSRRGAGGAIFEFKLYTQLRYLRVAVAHGRGTGKAELQSLAIVEGRFRA